MADMNTLHFSIGPVQGFVAQARRTRDFWAGSFLLSYLSAVAINYITNNNGEIVFPTVIENKEILDPLLLAINKCRKDDPPKFGSIPNRFQAKIPDNFDIQKCCDAIKDAWLNIANKVYEKYIKDIEGLGNDTFNIWQRQVENFWDIVWVIGEEPYLLDYRKNWRSFIPTNEPGDKCTLINNLQEISGYNRVKQKDKQTKFWESLRAKLPKGELRDDERLCAIALIKRLFPYVAQDTIGWRVIESFPSTTYLSAIPWLIETLKNKKDLAEQIVDIVDKSNNPKDFHREYNTRISSLEELADDNEKLKKFIKLDGNCFYQYTLDNDKLWADKTADTRRALKDILKKEKISPFYAFLLMDGDRMGALLQNYPDKQKEISMAINNFSRKVPNIIEKNDGIPIFAGGDDVLAFLPLDKAIQTARELRVEYQKCFKKSLQEIPHDELSKKATISAAIVYAHNHAPLNLLYSYIHDLLDNKAKEETGRDALAIAIWKTGGVKIEWASPWEKIVCEEGTSNLIDELVKKFSSNKTSNSVSSSFLYNLRKYLIFDGEEGYSLVSDEDFAELLFAEYMRTKTKDNDNVDPKALKQIIKELTEIMKIYRRNDEGEIKFTNLYNPDGALIIRFLANKGVVI